MFKILNITFTITSDVHEYSEVTQMIDKSNNDCTCKNKDNRDLVFSFYNNDKVLPVCSKYESAHTQDAFTLERVQEIQSAQTAHLEASSLKNNFKTMTQ